MAKEVFMPQDTKFSDELQRTRLREDVCRLLFDGMKKAKEAQNWDLFTRYVDMYRQMVG
jgi:hypothetical protein